jgi:hypothetical protein
MDLYTLAEYAFSKGWLRASPFRTDYSPETSQRDTICQVQRVDFDRIRRKD